MFAIGLAALLSSCNVSACIPIEYDAKPGVQMVEIADFTGEHVMVSGVLWVGEKKRAIWCPCKEMR